MYKNKVNKVCIKIKCVCVNFDFIEFGGMTQRKFWYGLWCHSTSFNCTVSKLWVIIGQTSASESGVSHFIALAGVTPDNIAINDISLKTRLCGLHFRCRKYWRIFNHFYVIRPKATEFGEITRRLGLLRRSRSFKVIDFDTNRKPIVTYLLSCTVSEI